MFAFLKDITVELSFRWSLWTINKYLIQLEKVAQDGDLHRFREIFNSRRLNNAVQDTFRAKEHFLRKVGGGEIGASTLRLSRYTVAPEGNDAVDVKVIGVDLLETYLIPLYTIPLIIAAGNGDISIMRFLLDKPETVQYAAGFFEQALLRAHDNGHHRVVHMLLEVNSIRAMALLSRSEQIKLLAQHACIEQLTPPVVPGFSYPLEGDGAGAGASEEDFYEVPLLRSRI